MKGKEFVEFHKKTVLRMNEICKAKNQDYSGGPNVDAFNNFKMVEKMGICTAEQGFLVRMVDKMMRINNITKSGFASVKDESVQDTLMDLANYSILMMGYLESKKTEGVKFEDVTLKGEDKEDYNEQMETEIQDDDDEHESAGRHHRKGYQTNRG